MKRISEIMDRLYLPLIMSMSIGLHIAFIFDVIGTSSLWIGIGMYSGLFFIECLFEKDDRKD